MNARLHRMLIELRWPLIVLVLAVILSGAIVSASWYIEQSKARDFQQVQKRLRAAQLSLNNARRESADLEIYRNRFEALTSHGIFGEEQRLSWVEYMTALSNQGVLRSLNYEIASQRPVTLTSLPQPAGINVLASRVQLKAGFVHEQDFIRIMDDLHQSNIGFYRLENCSIKRRSEASPPTVAENIMTDCKLRWITMQLRTGNK